MANGNSVHVDDRVWRKLLATAYGLDKLHVRVGVLSSRGGDAMHSDGEGEPISMTELAAIHEFGSPAAGIPERSFIRKPLAAGSSELAGITAKLAKAVVTAGMDPRKAYQLLGEWAKARIRRFVTGGEVTPEDAEATKVAKNRRAGQADDAAVTTLIDTGRLMNSVDYEVVEGSSTGAGAPKDPPGTSRDRLGRLRDSRGKFLKR